MKALCVGGKSDGKVLDLPAHETGVILPIDGEDYRVLNAPLWQGRNTIIGYATVLHPPNEALPGDTVARLYRADCVCPSIG